MIDDRKPQLLDIQLPTKKKKGRPSRDLVRIPKKGPREVKVRNDARNVFMPPSISEEKERILAEVFLYHGYGLSFAKSECTFEIYPNNYYSHMRSIFYRSFLKLTTVLAQDCKVPPRATREYASSRFKSEMCKCQDWMSQRELQTFHEYIRSVYEL